MEIKTDVLCAPRTITESEIEQAARASTGAPQEKFKKYAIFSLFEFPPQGDEKENVIALVRDNDKPNPILFKFPGGQKEIGEIPETTLIREINEELIGPFSEQEIGDLIHCLERKDHVVYFVQMNTNNITRSHLQRGQEVKDVTFFPIKEIIHLIREKKVLSAHADAIGLYLYNNYGYSL